MSFQDHLSPLAGASWPMVSQARIVGLSSAIAAAGPGWSLPPDYAAFLVKCDGSSYKEGWDETQDMHLSFVVVQRLTASPNGRCATLDKCKALGKPVPVLDCLPIPPLSS